MVPNWFELEKKLLRFLTRKGKEKKRRKLGEIFVG